MKVPTGSSFNSASTAGASAREARTNTYILHSREDIKEIVSSLRSPEHVLRVRITKIYKKIVLNGINPTIEYVRQAQPGERPSYSLRITVVPKTGINFRS